MGCIRFRTMLVSRGPAAAIVLDDGQIAELGDGAKRFPIVATVNPSGGDASTVEVRQARRFPFRDANGGRLHEQAVCAMSGSAHN
jgi:hypothetical protein